MSTADSKQNTQDPLSLTKKQFGMIQKTFYEVAGIELNPKKINMVQNRINKRMKDLNLSSFDAYIDYLEKNRNEEIIHLVNALTTNVTHFYREPHHFDHLKKTLASLSESGQTRVRMWSAGCSLGAEPYSAAISAYECMKQTGKKIDFKILATDIDTMTLAKARQGRFDSKYLKGVPKAYLEEHFTAENVKGETVRTVKSHIRNMVSFNYLNLNETKWPMSGPFDFIFCRNVLIYFNDEKQKEYTDRMTKLLKQGGYLLLGHSEHFFSSNTNFKVCGHTIYEKL